MAPSDDKYIVFVNGLSGFKWLPQLDGDNLKEVIQTITEGTVGLRQPSQHFMYFVYKKHESNVPLFGTRFDVYKRVQAVAGSKVEKTNTQSHEYAITHQSSMAWLFTDNMF